VVGERNSTRLRTLIVEDDPVVASALRALLLRWGHEAQVVATSGAALSRLVGTLPDTLILDLMLSEGSGVEVLRFVRKHELPVKVAVVTAANDPTLLRDVKTLRPDLMMLKPVDMTQLKQWLDRTAMAKE
jgi:CheY-like chemotaxis protein